jgi:uncharacterized membrane protein
MTMLPRLLFVLLLVVAPAVIWATAAPMPARVATHFGRGGYANGWMTHDGYLLFILAFTVLLPAFVVVMVGVLPQAIGSRAGIPNRNYWLAPERRAATLSAMASHACWLGCLLVVFLVAIHLLTVEANTVTPARLSESALVGVMTAFGIGILLWVLALWARFRRAVFSR